MKKWGVKSVAHDSLAKTLNGLEEEGAVVFAIVQASNPMCVVIVYYTVMKK